MKPRRLYALALAFLIVPGALFGLAAPSGPEIRVAAAGIFTEPLTAVFPDGGFVVAWTTGAKTSVIHARLFATSGTPVSGELSLLKPANQVLNAIAITSDGGFVVVWEQPAYTSVFARKFDRRGKPLTAAVKVHPASRSGHYGGKVAGTTDGGFVVAWTAIHQPDPDSPITHGDALARFFHGNGTAAGPPILLSPEIDDLTADFDIVPAAMAVAPDGSVAIVFDCFCDQPGLLLQRFTSDGTVSDYLDPTPPGCSTCQDELQLFPSLAMAPDGSFVVAWASGFGVPLSPDTPPSAIRASRLAADGTPLGNDVLKVNQHGRFTAAPHVAVLADGSFVVAWSDRNGRDGSGQGVFARTFDAAGNTSGPDLQLDLRTGGDQILSSIAAAAGRAVAVWLGGGLTVDARLLVP
jgi:hypothetical protein